MGRIKPEQEIKYICKNLKVDHNNEEFNNEKLTRY